ncbi:MAG: signal recognition particle-docking protein FtsY [Gammaproteobacteria bacterium]|nr:MAG: signal recognition particle-docking protein FtsY [Gammaproteobacteria bacterium]
MFKLFRNSTDDQTTGTPRRGLIASFGRGLAKTRQGLMGGLSRLLRPGARLDPATLEELEDHLLMADVGVEATRRIIDALRQRGTAGEPDAIRQALREVMLELLEPVDRPLEVPAHPESPFVILMVGINGAGKTTTIGKLAHRLGAEGRQVMLAAGDTFRAAAIEQLQRWGERNGVPVVAQQPGADPASVIFDALQSARARGCDVLIADTAGRLHTQGGLMEELKKVRRVMGKIDPEAPHEVMLVLDAGTGQNALQQVEQFNQAVGVTGITLTKLDGTARGGIVFALAERFGIPIRFIGLGEGPEDLRPFSAAEFVDALLATDEDTGQA